MFPKVEKAATANAVMTNEFCNEIHFLVSPFYSVMLNEIVPQT